MKKSTLKRINKVVINYLSIVGLWQGKHLDQSNPILMYFTSNILLNRSIDSMDDKPIILDNTLGDIDKFMTANIPTSFFHIMIKEFYSIYEKLDDINNNQNSEAKEIIINFIGNEYDFNKYIDQIMFQYKDALYDLIKYYNSNNIEYNNIKLKIFNNRMIECAELEYYEEAAKIRDKIKDIKEKGK